MWRARFPLSVVKSQMAARSQVFGARLGARSDFLKLSESSSCLQHVESGLIMGTVIDGSYEVVLRFYEDWFWGGESQSNNHLGFPSRSCERMSASLLHADQMC